MVSFIDLPFGERMRSCSDILIFCWFHGRGILKKSEMRINLHVMESANPTHEGCAPESMLARVLSVCFRFG